MYVTQIVVQVTLRNIEPMTSGLDVLPVIELTSTASATKNRAMAIA
jgi:hypothetical protein